MRHKVTGDGVDPDLHFCGFHNLMLNRVHNILLVSSLYESFILEEEGLLTELINSDYLDMHLSHAPRVSRVSTGEEALELIQEQSVDLLLTMTRVGQWNLPDFAEAVKEIRPDLPVVVLADETRDLQWYRELGDCRSIDRTFVWSGDTRILLAVVKYVEDMLNVEHDTREGNVRAIIVVENSVRFYSAYLPLIYSEILKLTAALMTEGINPMDRLLRMRARPKILLAGTFSEAWEYYSRYKHNLLGVISDVRFPHSTGSDQSAGIEFVRAIRDEQPNLPVLLQSSDGSFASDARKLEASFLNKGSPSLLEDLRRFLKGNLGFGDFVFATAGGEEVGRAHDLRTFEHALATVPDASLIFHAQGDHFSNWLMARTEFEMAARIRPRKVTDFPTTAELRAYLLETMAEFRERSQSGIIADFAPSRFDMPSVFTRIGSGSIGGKARGLAFVNALMRRYSLWHRFENVRIAVPPSAAISTDIFDTYLDENGLRPLTVKEGVSDREIVAAFLEAKLPSDIHADLAEFLRHVRRPLAARSSSLLEDSHDQPFAGIYATHMLPNNHPDLNIRLDQLCDAIKLVYASTFFRGARRYLEATGRHVGEEKMGVILQTIVGSEHGNRFYPTFSGVVRSYNFYPTGQMTPQDGIASVALGLGKIVVEGGETLMFSPVLPHVLPQFPTTQDWLSTSQRQFYALDTSHPEVYPTSDAEANLLKLGLDVAEVDGTLAPIGSVYSAENDVLYDGVHRQGTRLVTFAHVLKSNLFPLAEILKELLDIGVDGMACPIEIEFAVDMSKKPMEFGFLQVRPIIAHREYEDVSLGDLSARPSVCVSLKALGNGRIGQVADIVYVKPDVFNAAETRQIAGNLTKMNAKLNREKCGYVLIGPGRWGSADPWLGVPVTWDQISGARVIVEATLKDFTVTPSQGTHFFQNLTSLGVAYFTVDPTLDQGSIDWDWLASLDAVEETEFLRHVRLSEPLDIRVDGRSQLGIIFKPGS